MCKENDSCRSPKGNGSVMDLIPRPNIQTATPLSEEFRYRTGMQTYRTTLGDQVSTADEFSVYAFRHIWSRPTCVCVYLNPGPRPPAGARSGEARERQIRTATSHGRAGSHAARIPGCTSYPTHMARQPTADRGQQSTDHRPARARAWAHPPVERTQPTRPLALKERDLDPEQPACELGGRPGRRLGRLGAVSKRL